MQVSTSSVRGIRIVSVSGVIDRYATGELTDALVASVRDSGGMLVADISGVRLVTRAGARSFIVAAKLCETAGGAMRVCGARKPIDVVMRNLGFNHLIRLDGRREDSVAALLGRQVTAAARELFPRTGMFLMETAA